MASTFTANDLYDLEIADLPNQNISNLTDDEAEKFAKEMHKKTGNYYLAFHATAEEARVIKQAAKDADMPFGDYLRMKLDEYVAARWCRP
jgi:hypothetical protein